MQNNALHTPLQETHPLVTFIVCCYNLPIQMICNCIDSILSLSLQRSEREIILVDDGSDTNPADGMKQYGDDIICVRQENSGLSAARNLAISMATGRYLQFVDADDRLITTPYNHCLGILRTHEDADMVMFDFTSSPDERLSFNDALPVSGTEYMRHHNIYGSACFYVFRREILGELRFTTGIFHEDEEFTPQLLLRAERIYPTDARAYLYCQRPHSITSATDERKVQKRLDDLHADTHRLSLLASHLPQDKRLAMQRRVAQLTMDYLYQIIMQTRSARQLETRIKDLRSEGLFPLPNKGYSRKYLLFRLMTLTHLGRSLLLLMLPLLQKER